MKTLGSTHPHFVRCIIPNEMKTGGKYFFRKNMSESLPKIFTSQNERFEKFKNINF